MKNNEGLFMALQPKLIACGNSTATFAMAVRFLTGPAVMAVAAMAIGLRGDLLRVAIVQVNRFDVAYFIMTKPLMDLVVTLRRLHCHKESCHLCLQKNTMFIRQS